MDNPNGTMKPTVRDNRTLVNDGLAQEIAEFAGSKTKKIIADIADILETESRSGSTV